MITKQHKRSQFSTTFSRFISDKALPFQTDAMYMTVQYSTIQFILKVQKLINSNPIILIYLLGYAFACHLGFILKCSFLYMTVGAKKE